MKPGTRQLDKLKLDVGRHRDLQQPLQKVNGGFGRHFLTAALGPQQSILTHAFQNLKKKERSRFLLYFS